MSVSNEGALLSRAQVAQKHGVCLRTIARWEKNGNLKFPQPLRINGRTYYCVAQLDDWHRARAGQAIGSAVEVMP